MTGTKGDPDDRALWERAAAMTTQAAVPVSDADLAAWLDGRLPERDQARVEAALAADPGLLDAALETAGLRSTSLPPAPERLLVRARAVVAPDVVGARPRPGPGRVFGWRLGLQWAAVASLSVAVGIGGFSLGGRTHSALAGQRHGGSSYIAVLDSLGGDFDLGDPGSDP